MQSTQNLKVLEEEENSQWVKLLLNGSPVNGRLFQKIYLNSNRIIGRAIIKMRKELFKSKTRGNVRLQELEMLFNQGLINNLQDRLQELFLEPINNDKMQYILFCMKQNNWTLKDIYNEHIKYPEKRICRIISVKNK